MKKITNFLLVFVFCAMMFPQNKVSAAFLDATGLLGQINEDETPNYTSNNWSGIPTNDSGFSGPFGYAFDQVHHRLFAADQWNNRVLVFNLDTNNNLLDREADFVLGQDDFSSDDNDKGSSVNQSGMSDPVGLAYDFANDRLFVADLYNKRVLIFDTATIVNGEDAINVLGQNDFVTNGNGLSDSQFYDPKGIAYNSSTSQLFVSDFSNNRVLVFNLAGGITDGMAASNVLGRPDFTTNGQSLTQTGMGRPFGLAIYESSDWLFVSDQSYDRITVYDIETITNGEAAVYVIGQPDFTTSGANVSQNGLGGVRGISFGDDMLFVSEVSNNRVTIFDVSSITDGEDAINVLGQVDFTSNSSGTSQSNLNSSRYTGYDSLSKKLYVSDQSNNRVMIFDLSGAITDGMNAVDLLGQNDGIDLVWTSEQEDNGGYYLQFGFNPSSDYSGDGIAIDEERGFAFVVDGNNSRIMVFELDDNNMPVDMRADFVLGQDDFTSNASSLSQKGMYYPDSVEYDANNSRLFVSDKYNHRILIFDLSLEISNGMNASYVIGQTDFDSSMSEVSVANLYYPDGLSYDSDNDRLFVSDSGNNRILIFDLSSDIANGMNASYVLGQEDFNSDSSNTDSDGLYSPKGMDYKEGKLFVADYNNHRILNFDLSAGILNGMDANYVVGQSDFISFETGTDQDLFNGPRSVFYDNYSENIFVSDSGNNRILMFDVSSASNGKSAINVFEQEDFVSNSVGISQSEMNNGINSAFMTSNGKMYVMDPNNYRVMIFSLPNIISIPEDTIINTAYSNQLESEGGNELYTYSLVAGTLPTGLTLSEDGLISGTSTIAGEYTFTVKIEDSSYTDPETIGFSGLKEMTILVDNDLQEIITEQPQSSPKITSWKAYLNQSQSKCETKLKINIKGKHFDEGAQVKIGSEEALEVNVKNSKSLTATFCLKDLTKSKDKGSRNVKVINPDDQSDTADKKLRIKYTTYKIDKNNLDQNTPEGLRNIQKVLITLKYLTRDDLTGKLDQPTISAIKAFQRDNNLPQVGVVGPLTRAKMQGRVK